MNETENIAYDINGMFTVEESNREDTSMLVPAGEYAFTIVRKKIEQTNGNPPKIPPHTKVAFMLELDTPEGAFRKWDELHFYKKCMWKVHELAVAIGHCTPDATAFSIDWNHFEACTGRVQVKVEDYKAKDGTTKQRNTFKYLPPQAAKEEEVPF